MFVTREQAHFAYGSLPAPTGAETRAELRKWQAINNWSWFHLAKAMRAWGMSAVPGEERLAQFCQSKSTSLHKDSLRSLRRFMRSYPQPGDAETLIAQMEADREERARIKREGKNLAPIVREQEREAHIRQWMARELPANGRPAGASRLASNPLYGFDKATIRALSGGTL